MDETSRLKPYLYIAPLVALLVFVFGYPLVQIFEFSMKQIRGIDGPWIGFRNYELIFGQDLFWEAVAWSLLIAILLYDRLKGWKLYRIVIFVPYILAVPIIAAIMKKMFQFNGPVNEALRWIGADFLALDWIGSSDYALWTVMLLIIWREAALGIVLFLARLLNLDESLIEAAKLDGANWWQRVRHVILPQMRVVIEFYVVVSVITMLSSVFAYVYIMGGGRGGPGTSTMVVELYIFGAVVRQNLPGIASAVSVLLFLVSLLLIVPLFAVRRRANEEEVA
jgi:ABC-type sugar transport system permease subunit